MSCAWPGRLGLGAGGTLAFEQPLALGVAALAVADVARDGREPDRRAGPQRMEKGVQ